MEGAIGLVNDQRIGSSDENRNGLGLSKSSDFEDLSIVFQPSLLASLGISELISRQMIDMSNWDSSDGPADEIHIIPLDILHDHDSLLGQEMQRKLISGIL